MQVIVVVCAAVLNDVVTQDSGERNAPIRSIGLDPVHDLATAKHLSMDVCPQRAGRVKVEIAEAEPKQLANSWPAKVFGVEHDAICGFHVVSKQHQVAHWQHRVCVTFVPAPFRRVAALLHRVLRRYRCHALPREVLGLLASICAPDHSAQPDQQLVRSAGVNRLAHACLFSEANDPGVDHLTVHLVGFEVTKRWAQVVLDNDP